MATVTRTFELSMEAAAELDRRAQVGKAQPSDVVNGLLLGKAFDEDDFTPEQLEMIRQGEAEADAGIFASSAEVEAILSKYRGAA